MFKILVRFILHDLQISESAREKKIEKERKKQMREGIEADDEAENEASGTDEKRTLYSSRPIK